MEFIDIVTLREAMNRLGEAGHPFLWAVSYDKTQCLLLSDPMDSKEVLWQMGQVGNSLSDTASMMPGMRIAEPLSRDRYSRMFADVMAGLRRGDSFLANLTAATGVELDGSLRDVFLCSSAPYRLLIGDEFVCFSPEPFVRIDGTVIRTFPMKGTADASQPDAERVLLEDYKEICEHYTITDLMRNDLGSVAHDVRVEDFRYVEHIMTDAGEILQTSTSISGILPLGKARRFGDVLLPLLPAGSITGAPKEATVALIGRAETCPRGWYTGVFGYFDGHVMQSAVMIRCLQRGPDGVLRFHSGGGITVNSDEAGEYDEMMAKVYLTR